MDEWFRRLLVDYHVGDRVRVLVDAWSTYNHNRLVPTAGHVGRVERVEELTGGPAVTVSVLGDRVRLGTSALERIP